MVPIPKIETLEEQDADTPASKNGLLPGTFWGNRWRSVKETAQQSISLSSVKQASGDDENVTNFRMEAMQLMFGLSEKHAQQWPGVHVFCSRIEESFKVLLDEEFAIVWKIVEREKPQLAFEGWQWCCLVFKAFRAMQTVSSSTASIHGVVQYLMEIGSMKLNQAEGDRSLLAIFAVLCWTSMTVALSLDLNQIRESSNSYQHLTFKLMGHVQTDDLSGTTLSQTAKRPISKLFRSLKNVPKEAQLVGGQHEVDTLYTSTLNFASLQTISRIRLKWVEDLESHLSFDRLSRTMSVFCLPTYCAYSISRTQYIDVVQQVISELIPHNHYSDIVDEDGTSLHREVLLSYRLLFGQSSQSRSLVAEHIEAHKESLGAIDPLLVMMCSAATVSSKFFRRFSSTKFPAELFPACSLDRNSVPIDPDTYSTRDDFPHFGARLLLVQKHNLRQQPGRVRDLWRDRRNPLQWYTFWAVLWVGGLSIVLAVLQLIAAVVQAYYSVPPST